MCIQTIAIAMNIFIGHVNLVIRVIVKSHNERFPFEKEQKLYVYNYNRCPPSPSDQLPLLFI